MASKKGTPKKNTILDFYKNLSYFPGMILLIEKILLKKLEYYGVRGVLLI